tara:strand:- start:329 stop:784 length:456 start_codon:yes stop_codon:yes gene_type:complete
MNENNPNKLSRFISSSSQDGRSSERDLTEKQQKFLDGLINTGGDPKKAAELAGYAEGSYSQVIKSLKTEIIELASQILAQSAPKAAIKLVDVMESEQPIPQASVRLQAAQTILDRIGLGKTDRLDVNHTSSGGIFILPAKGEVIDGEYSEA